MLLVRTNSFTVVFTVCVLGASTQRQLEGEEEQLVCLRRNNVISYKLYFNITYVLQKKNKK